MWCYPFPIFTRNLKKPPWHYVALSISGFLVKISKNGRGTMWRYPFPDFCSKSRKTAVALCGAIHFRFLLKISKNSRGTMWRYVALSISGFLLKISKNGRGTMWCYPFPIFTQNLKKQPWHYVALSISGFLVKISKKSCGTMWRYVALSISGILVKISKNGRGTMWRYPFPDFCSKSRKVALCGAIHFRIFGQNLEKRPWHYVALSISGFLVKISKNGRGTMWRYPFPDFCSKSRKTAVALWGAIHFRIFAQNLEKRPWHYVALSISGFLVKISKNGRGAMWHYAALSISGFLVKSSKNGCGSMWHYVALSISGFLVKISKNGRGTMWHYVALSISGFLVKSSKNGCGSMWRYPFPDFDSKSRRTAVALCGVIHVLISRGTFRKILKSDGKRLWHSFTAAVCGALICGKVWRKQTWHYVAMPWFVFWFRVSNLETRLWRSVALWFSDLCNTLAEKAVALALSFDDFCKKDGALWHYESSDSAAWCH